MSTETYIQYLKNLRFLAAPLYYEGPLLSIQLDENDNIFVFKWVGLNSEKTAHKWIIYTIDKENLRKYFQKKISELALMHTALPAHNIGKEYMIVDIFSNLDYGNPSFFSVSELKNLNKYQPKNTVFYEKEYCEEHKRLQAFLQKSEDSPSSIAILPTPVASADFLNTPNLNFYSTAA